MSNNPITGKSIKEGAMLCVVHLACRAKGSVCCTQTTTTFVEKVSEIQKDLGPSHCVEHIWTLV